MTYYARCVVMIAMCGLFISISEAAKESTIDANPLDAYNVVWDSPSTDYNGSMPIGNGETGVNLWAEPNGDLIFLISRTDSWDENERLCKLGRIRVKFTPSLTAIEFKQVLNLRQGQIEITGGKGDAAIQVRLWVDANRQVIHLDADSQKPFDMQAELEIWRKGSQTPPPAGEDDPFYGLKNRTLCPDTIIGGQANRVVWYHRNTASTWEGTLRFQGLEPAIEIGTDPLLHRTFGGVIQADELSSENDRTLKSKTPQRSFRLAIHTHTQTPATEAQWLSAIEKNIDAADEVDHKEALKAHRKWWSDFWNRSWIFATSKKQAEGIDDAFAVTRGYVLQRWISACGGRGNFPIKFNGSIFTVDGGEGEHKDPDYRRWGGGYWFQNTRLPYWPMMASGDYDMMEPLFKMFLDVMPLAKIRTKIYFDHEGAFSPETMSFWGTYHNGDWGWGWRTTGKPGDPTINRHIRYHYSGTLELLAMMTDYYKHTDDKDFLNQKLLPVADEYLTWWDQHWNRDEQGKLHMSPSSSCETYWECTNPSPDIAGLMWNIDQLLSLNDSEIDKARRTRWTKLRKAIPPMPMMEKGGKTIIAPAEAPLPNRTNVENPELYTVFPFRLYGVGKPELQLARDTFHHRIIKRSWGWAQDETQAAYLGLADAAAELISMRAKTAFNVPGNKGKIEKSRFPAFWGPNYDWVPDQDHGGNLLMGLQTMVLQADDGKIRLLPAWPKTWDLDFKLHAPHNTTIKGRVRGGKLVDMDVTPKSRKRDIIIGKDKTATSKKLVEN